MSKLKPNELLVNPTTGQPILVPSPNFSYNYIPFGCCLKVHEYQEMILNKRIVVEGRLVLKGNLIFIR